MGHFSSGPEEIQFLWRAGNPFEYQFERRVVCLSFGERRRSVATERPFERRVREVIDEELCNHGTSRRDLSESAVKALANITVRLAGDMESLHQQIPE